MKRLAEAVLQRDSDTRARSSDDPMPHSGMHMHSTVTNEQREQRFQSLLKELGITDGKNFGGGFDTVWVESKLRARRDDDGF